MVAAGNGACDREHWRRDNRAQLRPRGGHDDDLAGQRATAPARPGAGGAAGHVHRPRGRRGQRGPGDERRPAAGGHRERGRVLPAASQDQDAGPDGGADLGQHQQRRRRPRGVVRGVRQPHAGTRRAGGRAAELGHRRGDVPVADARMGRRTGGHQPGVAPDHVRGGGRPGARPLASARRRVPAPAGRLGRVRRPRRGRDQLRRRGARHDRRGLAARPHRERALLRRAARRAGRGGLRRQRQPKAAAGAAASSAPAADHGGCAAATPRPSLRGGDVCGRQAARRGRRRRAPHGRGRG